MRTCLEINTTRGRLRGTVHQPQPAAGSAPTGLEGLGVVFLHPGFLPRSGLGDIAVALGDELARRGILCVRIDFPGLGDSEGELPKDALTYVQQVQEGRFVAVAGECLEQIQRSLALERVVVGGHCGGAVTGFFTLAARQYDWVCGLVALDTAFNLILEAESTVLDGSRAGFREKERVARKELYEFFHRMALKTSIGTTLRKLVQKLKHPGRAPAGDAAEAAPLPAEANRKLLECVAQVMNGKLPLLFVTADDPRKPANEFDYLQFLLERNFAAATTHRKIAGTDHAFLAGGGKQKMPACVAEWVAATFAAR